VGKRVTGIGQFLLGQEEAVLAELLIIIIVMVAMLAFHYYDKMFEKINLKEGKVHFSFQSMVNCYIVCGSGVWEKIMMGSV
jgi:hypothetical protein